MRRITVTAAIWAFLIWLATTWVGALLGFLFAWAGVLTFGAIVTMTGAGPDTAFPASQHVPLVVWCVLFLIASVVAVRAQSSGNQMNFERAGSVWVSLIGILLVSYVA